MTQQRSTRNWAVIAAICIGAAFASLVDDPAPSAATGIICVNNSQCGCTPEEEQLNCSPASGANGICLNGSCACNPLWTGTNCEAALGACCLPADCASSGAAGCAAETCTQSLQMTCELGGGTYLGDLTSCEPNPCEPTPTPTETATATPTPTSVPQGGDCADASQCVPGLFCSDAVCCDTACAGLGQSCDEPGSVGTCVTAPAEAPAASHATLVTILALLVATAFFALRARRR